MRIAMQPVGVIHSPYREPKDMPIQGIFKPEVEAWIELFEQYVDGLKDLEGFSHAILIYYFHKAQTEQVLPRPFIEDKQHGIFAIRGPNRPNHIGLSVVRITAIRQDRLHFKEVDVLDQTPVLDIKPYVKYFDMRDNVVSGWLDRHFAGGSVPDRTTARRPQ